MDIDWSKAPEGFPLWLEGTNEFHKRYNGWYRDCGQVFLGSSGGQWRAQREGQFFNVHRKPEPVAWNGEGLPPAGTVCEVVSPGYKNSRFDRFVGNQVTIVAHDQIEGDPVAVFRMSLNGKAYEQDYHALFDKCFRPIRTAEQIAAEERKRGIEELLNVFNSNFEGHVLDGLSAIYDAGYRKQAAE